MLSVHARMRDHYPDSDRVYISIWAGPDEAHREHAGDLAIPRDGADEFLALINGDVQVNDGIPRIDAREFREAGYLQEVNRQFFHPLGLAMEVLVAEDWSAWFGGVLDYRSDPEGIYFTTELEPHASNVARLLEERRGPREAALGYLIQPVTTEAGG